MDAYPPRDQQPDTQAQSSDEPDLADVMETMRAEQGRGLTAISEHELAILARVYRNNMQILRAHQFARFEGDMLVVSATEGKQDAVSTTRWQPFSVWGDCGVRAALRSIPRCRGRICWPVHGTA